MAWKKATRRWKNEKKVRARRLKRQFLCLSINLSVCLYVKVYIYIYVGVYVRGLQSSNETPDEVVAGPLDGHAGHDLEHVGGPALVESADALLLDDVCERMPGALVFEPEAAVVHRGHLEPPPEDVERIHHRLGNAAAEGPEHEHDGRLRRPGAVLPAGEDGADALLHLLEDGEVERHVRRHAKACGHKPPVEAPQTALVEIDRLEVPPHGQIDLSGGGSSRSSTAAADTLEPACCEHT